MVLQLGGGREFKDRATQIERNSVFSKCDAEHRSWVSSDARYSGQMINMRFVIRYTLIFNTLTPNDRYRGRTAPLVSKRCILYIYSTNIGTEYFKHGIYSAVFFSSN